MFSIMLFIFLCFFGILAVLYHMLRSQEKLCCSLREEHAQMRVLLRALESRLDGLEEAEAPHAAGRSAAHLTPRSAAPSEDPLLHLSFDEPAAAPQSSAGIDPALDLHFDPAMDLAPSSGANRI